MKPFWLSSLIVLPLLLAGTTDNANPQPAAWPLFRVYSTQGANQLRATDGKMTPVRKGQYIYQGQLLRLKDEKCRIILFDQDTNYTTLDKKGDYTTDAIQAYRKQHLKDGITAKYSAFFWEEFFKPRPSQDPSNTGDVARSSGGVYRGGGGIRVLTPAPGYATSMRRLPFRWRRVKGADSYEFRIMDADGNVAFESRTSDTSMMLRFPATLRHGDVDPWELRAEGTGLPAAAITTGRLQWVDEDQVLPALHLTEDAADPGGVLHDLRLIGLYESKGCIRAAQAKYRTLLKRYPDDRALKAMYRSFLKNNYIDHEDHAN